MSAERGALHIHTAFTAISSSVLLLLSGCSALLPERHGIPTPMTPAVIGGNGRTPTPAAAPTGQIPVIVLTATPVAAPTSATAPTPAPLPEDGVVVGSRPPAPPPCGQRTEHVVRAGETLYSIAIYHHTTVAEIMRLNRIRDARAVAVGRRLVLTPCSQHNEHPAQPTRRYVVRAGDNLFRIGLRFGVSADRIRAANGLRSNAIHAGQVLIIP